MKIFAKLLSFILLTAIFLCNFISVGECREFVFVVNASQSMNNSDPQKKIAEGVAWSIANLNSDDEVAVISFNDVPLTLRPLTKVPAVPNKTFNLNYTGNSNAGDAIFSAVDMLADKFDTERNIIFITDGEIKLADDAQTSRSIEKFQQGLQQAGWSKMNVYIVNLRNSGTPQNYRSYSNLATEIQVPHTELLTALRNIVYDDFHAPHLTLPVQNGRFSTDIPLTHFDKIKLLVLSANPGSTTLENFNQTKTFGGNFVQIFEINSPQTNKFDFTLNYPQATGLTLDVVPYVEGILQTEIETHLFSADTLTITPTYKNNSAEKIFADNFFENKSVRVLINDKEIKSAVKGGIIQVDLPSGEKNISLQKVYFDDLGVEFGGETSASITLPDDSYVVLIFAGLAIAAIIILSYLLHNKETPKPEEKITQPPAPVQKVEKAPEITEIALPEEVLKSTKSKEQAKEQSNYNGKLAIYVTKTANDEDVAPREFNLFRFGKGIMPLIEILAECKVAEHFQNIGDIFISPSKHGIYLANNSDSTILKRGHLIERGKQTELYYEDSISIATPDEQAELILRYKSLKPN